MALSKELGLDVTIAPGGNAGPAATAWPLDTNMAPGVAQTSNSHMVINGKQEPRTSTQILAAVAHKTI